MLQINDKLRIRRLDDKNIIIEELNGNIVNKHTKEARAGWQWRGYYGTLESALKGILSKQLLDSIDDEITLKEVLDKIEQVRQEIKNAKIIDLEEDE